MDKKEQKLAVNRQKEYRLLDFGSRPVVWQEVDLMAIDAFPWYQSGDKQQTLVQLAISQEVLMIQVRAFDNHASAEVIERNGPTYKDSCFEFFVTPVDNLGGSYINFEVNCIGTLYLAYNKYHGNKRLATDEQHEQVTITTLLEKGVPYQGVADWGLTLQIPLSLLADLYGQPVSSTVWYANCYRCGGQTDPQYAAWQPIEAPIPDYHRPEQFGRLVVIPAKA